MPQLQQLGNRRDGRQRDVVLHPEVNLVLVATPIDLTRLIRIDKPNMRIGYRLEEEGSAFVDAVTRTST